SLFAIPPLLIVALVIDPHALVTSFAHLDWASVASIAYIVYLSTLFGYAVWSRLLSHYPAATVAPFALLVPIFGFLGSAVLLVEPIRGWKVLAALLGHRRPLRLDVRPPASISIPIGSSAPLDRGSRARPAWCGCTRGSVR